MRFLNLQLSYITGRGERAFFDLEHENTAPVFHPTRFVWSDTSYCIFAVGRWTELGKIAVESGEYKGFSTAFKIDRRREIARVTARPDHSANMGGLTNAPRFVQLKEVLIIL